MVEAALPEVTVGRSRLTGSQRVNLFVRKRWLGMIGLGIVTIVLLSAVFAPWIAPYDPNQQSLRLALEPPRWGYPFGNDELGRDILSRVIWGGRISLIIGFGSVLLGLLVGAPAGILAGYRGGWVDALIMRAMDILLSFPGFILAAAIIAVLGIGVTNLIIALGLRTLPVLARLARNMTLSLREAVYVDAARVVGAGDTRILFSHIMPNLLSALLVVANLRTGSAILTGTALSFLGMGVPPGTAEWGVMLNGGLQYMRAQGTHLMIFPGLAIVVTVLGINLLGDDLRDMWDPRLRS